MTWLGAQVESLAALAGIAAIYLYLAAAAAIMLVLLYLARRRRLLFEGEVEAARQLLQHSAEAILRLDAKARIREVNPAACRLFGQARQHLLGQPAASVLGKRLEAKTLRQAAGEQSDDTFQTRGQTSPPPPAQVKDVKVVLHPQRGWRGRPRSYLCRLLEESRSVRRPKGAAEVAAARHDSLTGLPSRERFLQRLERAVIQMVEQREGYACTVMVFNLDRFKQVNDHLGPALADQALVAVAERLSGVTAGSYLARLEGDRFGLLLDGEKQPAALRKLVEELQAALARPLRVQGHELRLTTAVGIVANAHDYRRGTDLLRDATIAMARAKSRGVGQHQLFERAQADYAMKDARIEADLRKAVDNGELRPVFQPIVDIKQGRVAGFETLVRWRHPEHGEIRPDEFVDIAEESEKVVPIGRELRAASCQLLAQWQQAIADPELYLSFNLTDHEARRPELIAELAGYLESHGLAAGSVRIELVERMLLAKDTRAALDRIVKLGLPLYIDDFGTGYSSLSRLHDTPTHTIKIDRSFVQQMAVSEQGMQIVRSIVSLGQSLGVHLLAEGVETSEQLRLLARQGCYSIQGYLFSPPVEAGDVPALLRNQDWVKERIRAARKSHE